MKKLSKKLLVIGLIFSLPTLVYAEEDTMSYDSIVSELTSTRSARNTFLPGNPFSGVLIHAGVGMAMSMYAVQSGNKEIAGIAQGVEINFGIDLFNPLWMAEGSFRNFGSSDTQTEEAVVKLTEFDLKLVYRPSLGRLFRMRIGGGLAARYLEFFEKPEQAVKYNTPSSIFSFGLDAKLSRTFSIGIETSYRAALIDETIDNSAMHAALRLDAHF